MGSSLHSAPSRVVIQLPGAIARSDRGDAPEQACRIHRRAGLFLGLLALAAVALQTPVAGAHETDQSTLPLGREFADLKVPLSEMVQAAIVKAVKQTNRAIEHSLWRGQPTDRTVPLQSVDWIAAQVWSEMFSTFPTNEGLDIVLAGDAMRARYPGLITMYRPEQLIYDDPLLVLDVTKATRTLFRAGTINVDGTLLGTDKIIHFVHLGHIYYSSYREARKSGVDEARAVAKVVHLSAGYNPFLSENGFLGMVTTGIRSNGDLAANYAGFKFYRNLTETVRIGDRVLPPMLTRAGLYWQIDERVRNQPDFFAAYLTPHLNEALNPNTYAVVTDTRVRKMIRSRCPDMLARYRDERGYPLSREQFTRIEQDLSTFYGEDYGYQSDGDDRISIATVCFAHPVAGATGATAAVKDISGVSIAAHRPGGPGADRLGRSALWWAARDGRRAEVEALLAAGEDPNAADMDGETPLHAAARWGRTAVVRTLLAQGANPGATALYGMTPLHVAVEEARLETSLALLELGADANARDLFGASPLHQAAGQGNQKLATLLLAYGADPSAIDDSATTPPQLAERSGNATLAKLLSFYAASPAATQALHRPGQGEATAQEPGGILHASTNASSQPVGPAVPAPDADTGAADR